MPRLEWAVPKLGPRGEGWVALQFALLAAIVAAGLLGPAWPRTPREILEPVGLLVLGAGAGVLALGVAALGRSLTPLPRPLAGATLCRRGIYRRARHPIYGGLIAIALGWSLAEAPLALPLAVLLAGVLALKSRSEEAWLLERHPGYAAYRDSTPARFLPRPF
jgi:protein-S-isoprenylcysteine O-methyltransferase Ste14